MLRFFYAHVRNRYGFWVNNSDVYRPLKVLYYVPPLYLPLCDPFAHCPLWR
jgi:hypothetical protein